MTIVLVAQQAEDIADWFAIMQRNVCKQSLLVFFLFLYLRSPSLILYSLLTSIKCGIIGDQTVFGVDLAAAAGKRGKNIQIPMIIENSLLYLFSGGIACVFFPICLISSFACSLISIIDFLFQKRNGIICSTPPRIQYYWNISRGCSIKVYSSNIQNRKET